jgi:mitotic spindle assembly checkpoint protein MAD1
LLQEKITSLEHKLSLADKQMSDYATLELAKDAAAASLSLWMQTVGALFPALSDPGAVRDAVLDMRTENLRLLESNGRLSTTRNRLQESVQELEAAQQATDERNQKQQEQMRALEAKVAATAAQLSSATSETKSLKALLDSVNFEDTQQKHDSVRIARIEALELQLAESNKALAETNAELALVTSLKEENKKLQKHLQQTEADNAMLSSRLSRGEFDPATTRVLHLIDNPMAQARQAKQTQQAQQIKQLQLELTQLRSNPASTISGNIAASLVSGFSQFSSSSSADSSESQEFLRRALTEAQETIKVLKKGAEDNEKRSQRLKSVFTAKAQEFRDACYQVTGWAIELVGDKLFRAKCIYAERSDDSLLFQLTDSGVLQLCDTDFHKRLDSTLRSLLPKFRSIPFFVASVTGELFQAQTRV